MKNNKFKKFLINLFIKNIEKKIDKDGKVHKNITFRLLPGVIFMFIIFGFIFSSFIVIFVIIIILLKLFFKTFK